MNELTPINNTKNTKGASPLNTASSNNPSAGLNSLSDSISSVRDTSVRRSNSLASDRYGRFETPEDLLNQLIFQTGSPHNVETPVFRITDEQTFNALEDITGQNPTEEKKLAVKEFLSHLAETAGDWTGGSADVNHDGKTDIKDILEVYTKGKFDLGNSNASTEDVNAENDLPIDSNMNRNDNESNLNPINFNEGLNPKFTKLLTKEENAKANDIRKETYEFLAKCFDGGLTNDIIDKLDAGLKGSMSKTIGGIIGPNGGCSGTKGKSFAKYLEEDMGIKLSDEDKEKINHLTSALPEIVSYAP